MASVVKDRGEAEQQLHREYVDSNKAELAPRSIADLKQMRDSAYTVAVTNGDLSMKMSPANRERLAQLSPEQMAEYHKALVTLKHYFPSSMWVGDMRIIYDATNELLAEKETKEKSKT